MQAPIKIIEVQDQYSDNSKNYPYIHTVSSHLRLLLRSKKSATLQPLLIIDKLKYFQPILPITQHLNTNSQFLKENFQIIQGKFNEDGEWECDIQKQQPGVLHFQIIFVPYGQNIVKDTGSCDTILLVQNKIEMKRLSLLTVFPRCIGRRDQWPSFFQNQRKLGYNAFHFAPIQQTGQSRSYYSISNQLQLSNDLFQGSSSQKYEQLSSILKPFQQKGTVFFADILLNHLSFDSTWIKQNKNAVFTIQNTPKLASAYVLDRAVREWGDELKVLLQDTGIKMDEEQFSQIKKSLRSLVENLHLEEFFCLPQSIKSQFLQAVPTRKPSENLFAPDPSQIILQFFHENIEGLGCCRNSVKVKNVETKWKELNVAYEESDFNGAIKLFNLQWKKKILNEWVPQIIESILNQIRSCYLDNSYRSYIDPYPFVQAYFTTIQGTDNTEFAALNNGWVGGTNSNENLATSDQFFYLRRKVNSWGDLIRIRYGDTPLDSPAWEYISEYVKIMAKYFDGFRLDNLHGTQMNVGEFMIKEARKVKPQIIIFAELFTSSEQEKAYFVRKMGINSTLKEMKYNIDGNSFIHTFHDKLGPKRNYMGSIDPYFKNSRNEIYKYSCRKKPIALLYDMTHDNRTYQEEKSTIIKTPMCLLISLLGTFIGSTKGFDQFYSHQIKVTQLNPLYEKDTVPKVTVDRSEIEKRKIVYEGNQKVYLFGDWNEWKEGEELKNHQGIQEIQIELPPGKYEYKFKIKEEWVTDNKKKINSNNNHEFYISANRERKVYNNLQELRKKAIQYRKKYIEMDQFYAYNNGNLIIMVKEKFNHEQAVCVIANLSTQPQKITKSIELPGVISNTEIWHQNDYQMYQGFTTDVQILYHTNIYEYFDCHFDQNEQKDVLSAYSVPPGFSCLIYCKKSKSTHQIIKSIQELNQLPIQIPSLGALDYNLLMFGANNQELARFGQSNYVLPESQKQLIYGGFGGIYSTIRNAKKYNDLSSSLFDNLRSGNWILDYYIQRIRRFKNLHEIAQAVQIYFNALRQLPNYLKPKFFTTYVYNFCETLSKNICQSNINLQKLLCLASTQFISSFHSDNPLYKVTLAAGLPHFSTGWSRSWGRDTFISNQLLLLHPNIYRDIIVQFASAERHGMIPNLLDSGNNPRYNCRDAPWWFIRAVKEYANHTKDYEVFKAKVDMIYLNDDLLQHKRLKKQGVKKVIMLEEVIQKIFQKHADGISYRQWYAGYEIDSNMSSQGFNIQLMVDQNTGFVVGGNSYNCLTWMDKMGSSPKANNKGFPATPRAGTPVQLVGLLYHCLIQYSQLYKKGYYSFEGVDFKKRNISFSQWAQYIKNNFESSFYVSEEDREKKYVGIYKDVINVSEYLYYEEDRLRPNALIAMAISPELFSQSHALLYLQNVQRHLLSPKSIGVSTLGELHDSLYVPYYDNSDDSGNLRTAHGFSYHNGPEWVWLYGFYVVAKCHFTKSIKKHQALGLLQKHYQCMENSEWMSLPELTNRNGEQNVFSCSSQAWSISSILLALKTIKGLK